ncbi:DUF2085 domain-containing protein [Candidatus Stoquefichus massiliensis]|uniref:DUF2085 domain-containing protein n=1 Tax=Candidatus Stoquefichus massiliensis TaxID=1470350 RepID=UPI000483F7E5|nr:DUF2085 domain-containing protein [Candidatus Stoquefichus massiliensis]
MSKIIAFLVYRFSHIGEIPICNGIAERAPHFMGYCFLLCYRCTFIILAFLITLLIFYHKKVKLPIWLLILCMVPMIVDGSLQTFFGVMSENWRRALTGSFFGFGLAGLIAILYMHMDERTF